MTSLLQKPLLTALIAERANPERLANLKKTDNPALLTLLDGLELLLSGKHGTGLSDPLGGHPWASAKLEMAIQSGNV